MTRSGRPLRFLAVTLAGWTALRVIMLWPAEPTPASIIQAIVPEVAANPIEDAGNRSGMSGTPGTLLAPSEIRRSAPFVSHPRPPDSAPRRPALALAAPVGFDGWQIAVGPPGEMIPLRTIPSVRAGGLRGVSRWSADLWLVARGGSEPRAGFGNGQLGGAQAGVRVAYTLDHARRLAAFARADTPLSGKGREVAGGLEWRPTRLPVRVVIEERVPLDGGKAAPAAGLVGGFGPVLARGIRVEAYGQAGVLARGGGEGFADGAVRATRPIGSFGGLSFDLGAGVWGGAQRDTARLDLGPTLGAMLPIEGHAIRLALDWRERVAGRARPGSGLALTIGASF